MHPSTGRGRSSEPAPSELVAFIGHEYGRVHGALTLYLGDPATAHDLAQEAFIRVCQHWDRVRRMDAPGAWVHRVAMNLATTALRRRNAEGRALQRAGSAAGHDAPASDTDGAVDIRAAVTALPLAERAAIVLRYFADLTTAETASVLGIPEGTVKTRARRALANLRREPGVPEVIIDG